MEIQRADDLLLKGGRVLDPVTGLDEILDVRIVNGRIHEVGKTVARGSRTKKLDLTGRIVAPGFIDMHVHLREPGYEHKETILSGCSSAAAGGFTAVCCMPNTNPAIDDGSVVRFIQEKGRIALQGLVDVYPIAAVTVGRKGECMAPLAELAEAGAVGFSDDGDPVSDSEVMRRALEYAGMFGRPVIQHAQDIPMTRGGVMHEGFYSTELGLQGMPGIAEEVMIARDIALVAYTGGRYHVAHVSTAGAVELIRSAKSRNLPVTCEVTPHHFMLTHKAVRDFDTNTKMNPPLRSDDDVLSIIGGLKDGTIDVIATDHAPHSFDEKQVEFQSAPFGVVGLETAIGLSLTALVHKGVITLSRMIELFSRNPRRILSLPVLKIAHGETANLTLLDPDVVWRVDTTEFHSRSRNSPFEGYELTGRAVGVVNNGLVHWG